MTIKDDSLQFEEQVKQNIDGIKSDTLFKNKSIEWMKESVRHNYSYNFKWMGRPIIQYPADIIVMQEIIWNVKPDCIIETGIARGGSAVFYSSMLELLQNSGKVISIDIELRAHNRQLLENHPMYKNIIIIEGDSTSTDVTDRVKSIVADNKYKNILVSLDSSHTHEHVLKELNIYSRFVSPGGYICVFDTFVEDMPAGTFDRPWDKSNNPRTAAEQFLNENRNFELDEAINEKLVLTASYGGFIKRIR